MFLKTIVTVASLLAATVQGGYVGYPRPSIYSKSAHFSLKVNGTDMYTVSYAGYDYVQFSMDEGYDTEIIIEARDQASINSYTITPQALPIKARVDGKKLIFKMKKAHYLIVKINSMKEFVVGADPSETNVPKLGASNVFNVLDYKADNTGAAITAGVQAAIDAAAKRPGSIVYVPPGLYLVGNLVIRDRTSLYLAGGSVLRFTGKKSDYKVMYTKSDLGDGTWWISTDKDTTGIKIFGRGTIDGNGYNTRKNTGADKFMASMVVPAGTKDFHMDGVLVRDSSFWAVNVVQVQDSTFTNLKIFDRFDVTQDDGIDINESSNVKVRRVIAIANDDSFSAKTWPYKTGTTVPFPYQPRPNNKIWFDDCLAWTLCYAYKIGEGVWEEQSEITFQNSYVYYAGVGCGINHKYGSASARNITWQNIDIERLGGSPGGQAAWATLYVNFVKQGAGPIGPGILLKNIKARMKGKQRGLIQGYDASSTISDVTFTDIYMENSPNPATSFDALNMERTNFYSNINIKNTK
ncbi:uncharacterized protein E0L32_003890 [Thyridium curvatum]|uniref:Pectate lyase superfamily protein domain-containing protein n=1 Tax=Thyridium curvatum TaxID=1093900 RepID=A0A507BGW9_9PEZI|nr:uncharacterized protein E0L32_003890 [Thyridium curvatum]TPX16241.1 hypothetical protein E0L32_003890 [Thyridium curvatum]